MKRTVKLTPGQPGRPVADPRAFLQKRLGITFTADSERFAAGVLAHVQRREREITTDR